MSNIKSHFKFSKQERSGIFVLTAILIAVMCVYFFVDFSSEEIAQPNDTQLQNYRRQVDSLRKVAQQEQAPKIFPFNPNYITDYKGYTLGMSTDEIDRLHKFRNTNKWVNSAKDFQKVTKISDSLLAEISPYFKFPEWVTNPKPKTYSNSYSKDSTPKTDAQKQNLNTATAIQLQKVYGIGEGFSKRIIQYRDKYNGFVNTSELSEIWGLTPEVIQRVEEQFVVKTPRQISRFNINTATQDQLVTIPNIDYEIANNIIEERTLREGFKNLDDLTKVEQFPIKKLAIIKLYLYL